jgi:N-acetylglucosaminyl-diphospho-decaprenol L-rhamnosyltransferase
MDWGRQVSGNPAEVAVVIVNYRTPELTMRCLAALRGERELLPKLRAVVVDGGSGDDSAADLAKGVMGPDYLEWVAFLPLPINGGFGWANNQAILTLAREAPTPEFIHLLNPDTEVERGAVGALVEALQTDPRCGAAGSQLLTPDGRAAASAFPFPSAGNEFVNASLSERLGALLGVGPRAMDPGENCEVDWVTGASVMLRSAALRESGLFDDGFFLYFEEVELMHRIKAAGWTVRHVSESRVVHAEGASTGIDATAARPHPDYWYQSRRRYFGLTGGRAGVIGANTAWLAGSAVAALKAVAGRGASKSTRTADLIRNGWWPRPEDTRASCAAWNDPPGKPPAWMSRQ